jgi:hypothetical protein
MRYIPPEKWAHSVGIPRAGRLFVARLLELTDQHTLDSYRVRHLNIRLGLEELAAVIAESEESTAHLVNVKDVAAEVLRLFKEDPVAPVTFPNREHSYPTLVEFGAKVNPGLGVLVDHFRRLASQRYRTDLLESLRHSVLNDDEDRTLRITSALVTDLIADGHDHRHLYWRGEYFIKQPARPFLEKFTQFIDRCRPPLLSQNYSVIFRLAFGSLTAANQFPGALGTMAVTTTPLVPLLDPRIEPFGRPVSLFRFVTVSTHALDPFSASRKAAVELAKSLDVLQLVNPMSSVLVLPTSLVMSPDGSGQYVRLTLELLGPVRVAHEDLMERSEQLSAIALQRPVQQATRDRLFIGLQNLRRALTDIEPRSQFLNAWMGLEAVLGGTWRTDIAEIRRCVARFIASGYPRRILLDLLRNVRKMQIDPGEEFREAVDQERDQWRALAAFWRIIWNPERRARLLTASFDHPLLEHRILGVAQAFGDARAIKSQIRRNLEDVEWHVQRMYRFRNAIAHGGYVPDDLTLIGSHLVTYLWAILRALISELANPAGVTDVRRFLDKAVWLYDRQAAVLDEMANAPEPPFSLILQPERML